MTKILKYPNPNLLIPSQHITQELFGSGELEETIKMMKEILRERKKTAAGLSAIQIGCRFSLFILQKGLEVFCNPVIIDRFGEPYFVEEGCLSLEEGKKYHVERYPSILLRYQRKNGKEVARRFSGYLAQIVQHEVCHTQGILINSAKTKFSYDFSVSDDKELNEFFDQVNNKGETKC
jgi:peptide deformylase